MTKTLSQRLDWLEIRLQGTKHWPVMIWMMEPIERSRRKALAPNEHIVEDWYRDFHDIVWARQRIATDPADGGQRCEPGGYLEAVIRELHQTCEFRETGGCMNCVKLDLTGSETASEPGRDGDVSDRPSHDAEGFSVTFGKRNLR
jgi:hypothetical protein